HRCIYKYLYQKHEDTHTTILKAVAHALMKLRRQLKHHTTFLLLGAVSVDIYIYIYIYIYILINNVVIYITAIVSLWANQNQLYHGII
ncbi:hypothetical protein ACJX0J_033796, partial [Zea mays]